MRVVEQLFVTLKGSALMLSSRDVALTKTWEETGVPVRVVCAAIEHAFQTHRRTHGPDAAPPRSLSYCAPTVAEAVAGWQARMVGHNPVEDET